MININRILAVNIILLFTVILSSSALAETDKAFILHLSFDEKNLTFNDISVVNGSAPDRRVQPDEGYTLEVISPSRKVLYLFKFNIPNRIITMPPPEGYPVENIKSLKIKQGEFSLIFPYFPNANKIKIYTPDDILIMEIDVSRFADPSNQDTTTTPFWLIIILPLVIMFIIAFAVMGLYHRHHDSSKSKSDENAELRVYILNCLNKGIKLEKITEALKKEGWDEGKIKNAVDKIKEIKK